MAHLSYDAFVVNQDEDLDDGLDEGPLVDDLNDYDEEEEEKEEDAEDTE